MNFILCDILNLVELALIDFVVPWSVLEKSFKIVQSELWVIIYIYRFLSEPIFNRNKWEKHMKTVQWDIWIYVKRGQNRWTVKQGKL